MTIDYYYMIHSPPCASVLLTAKALGVDLNKKVLASGDQLKPEYVKINPQHAVPAIVDDGYALAESRAILVYLATKYGKDDTLYPKDARKRGLVEHRLNFDIGTLYQRFVQVYMPAFRGGDSIDEEKLPKLKEAFEILDGYLSKTKWVAGDHITVADHSLVASVGSMDAVNYDLSPFKNVTRWYKDCQKEMPGYKETNQVMIVTLREWVKEKFPKML